MKLLIAEKPSVARSIANALGLPRGGKGSLRGKGLVVSWCLGHLAELKEPGEYDPGWKRWSLAALPMLPERFELRAIKRTRSHFTMLKKLLRDRSFEAVINACDAGREGELIFRYCYELSGSRLPVERLWLSSLTTSAIRAAFARLRPGRDFEPLESAARGRACADWLVGMNATRAYTLKAGDLRSLGRVQTPTLAMLVRRDKEIAEFVPEDYWEVFACLPEELRARWFAGPTPARAPTRLASAALADTLIARLHTPLVVERVDDRNEVVPPPRLFDLNALQRTANRRFGISAARCLSLLQELYEKDKLVTYPRTDSRYVPRDVAAGFPSLVAKMTAWPAYGPLLAGLPRPPTLRHPRRFVDNAKVTDHHAILPTGKGPVALSGPKARIFDLVARQLLAIFFPDARFARRVVILRDPHGSGPGARPAAGTADSILEALPAPPDRFSLSGKVCLERGWQTVLPPSTKRRDEERALPDWAPGTALEASFSSTKSATRPPPHYTDASLIGALENAGRGLDDKGLRKALAECGLGTPATRAATIETLLSRGYAARRAKSLVATPLGSDLIEKLPVAALTSPQLTAEWEQRLARIAAGDETLDRFLSDLRAATRAMVESLKALPESAPQALSCPRCPDTADVLKSRVRCKNCGFVLERRIAGRTLSPAELTALFSGGTGLLRGFRSRKGKTFSARLRLGTSGEVDFELPRKTKKGKRFAKGAGARGKNVENRRGADKKRRKTGKKQVLTATGSALEQRCPLCGKHPLIVGNQAWGCGGWRGGCPFRLPFSFRGKALSEAQRKALLDGRKTRLAGWPDARSKGRLKLEGPRLEVVFEPA